MQKICFVVLIDHSKASLYLTSSLIPSHLKHTSRKARICRLFWSCHFLKVESCFQKCNFPMTPHVRLLVGWLVVFALFWLPHLQSITRSREGRQYFVNKTQYFLEHPVPLRCSESICCPFSVCPVLMMRWRETQLIETPWAENPERMGSQKDSKRITNG